MPWITKEGRTVDEARDAAVAEARLAIDDLDIEIVNEGAKGLFGLGGEPAVVRVRPKTEATDFRHAFSDDITPSGDEAVRAATARAPVPEVEYDEDDEDDEVYVAQDTSVGTDSVDGGVTEEDSAPTSEQQEEAAKLGVEIVQGIIDRMGVSGTIATRVAGNTVYIEISGDEMGILIGRNGTTLEALQELVRAGIQRRLKSRQAIVVDVESYWERRRKEGGSGKRRESEGSGQRRGGGSGSGGGQRRRGGRRRRGGGGGQQRPPAEGA